MTLMIENREQTPIRNQQPNSQRCAFQHLVEVFHLCSLGIKDFGNARSTMSAD